MSDEQMTILRMVADKKITAEEGAQLLEALNEQRTESASDGRSRRRAEDRDQRWEARVEFKKARRQERDRRRRVHREERDHHRQQWRENRERWRSERQAHWQEKLDDLSRMFEGVFGKEGIFGAGGVFGQGCNYKTYTDEKAPEPNEDTLISVEEGTRVNLTTTNGDVIIRGVEGDQLRLMVPGNKNQGVIPPLVNHEQTAKQVHIASANQNIILEIPWQVTGLQIAHTNGNMRLINLSADLDLTFNDGNLSAQDLTGGIHAGITGSNADINNLHSSDVDIAINDGPLLLSMDMLREGVVKLIASNGPISLSLPDTSSFDLNARVTGGKITSNLFEVTDDAVTHTHNDGGASITMEAQQGNIDIRVEDTGATEKIDEGDVEESNDE